ncbi:uncharacterized protein K460DRAFT_416794 [Cucurbitaria berberidis CBS 394.84]|uniref:Uncharacterized protein n=1 Tax=Cucurbitaria berberidis CBS 394.84 TaxID=1168544 RepID=A0A9P4GHS9_9PLEO|nr:uncharacterized protein K460DRAFT_416794 [Cucurbitaria berberidis CBS 394.84]KAF1845547.1 hypothetical protein K460DRAFT_416794 [Cucurbitaria berberidis CBS 394.84]
MSFTKLVSKIKSLSLRPKPARGYSHLVEPANESDSDVQTISVGNINPVQLVKNLELKFPSGFEVQIMHNVYSIRAPRRLSLSEIEECRRDFGTPSSPSRGMGKQPKKRWAIPT